MQDRRPITIRTRSIERRINVGHWEGDSVIGAAHQHAIVTVVERKANIQGVTNANRKTSNQVSAAITKRPTPHVSRVKPIMYDNVKGFAGNKANDQSLGASVRFADPCARRKRGSNESYNGLLRKCIPEKRHQSTVTDRELKMIEDRLNHRPRKRSESKTPHQVFHGSLNRVVLRD